MRLDGYNIDYKLDQILSGLPGLYHTIKEKKISELSGGQKEKSNAYAAILTKRNGLAFTR